MLSVTRQAEPVNYILCVGAKFRLQNVLTHKMHFSSLKLSTENPRRSEGVPLKTHACLKCGVCFFGPVIVVNQEIFMSQATKRLQDIVSSCKFTTSKQAPNLIH